MSDVYHVMTSSIFSFVSHDLPYTQSSKLSGESEHCKKLLGGVWDEAPVTSDFFLILK